MAASSAPAAPPPVPTAPAIRYPLPPAPSSPKGALPSLDDADAYLKNALVDLLGRKAVMSFLKLDNVVRRIVATVDNLGTDNAAAQLWPVEPTPGRLETESRDGGLALGAKNAERYAPFVRLVEGVDTRRAVALYTRLYPLLQRGYEELGYGGKYFNDRVVEVIDNLLATPTIEGPIKVKRIAVDGAASATTLYVFEDPDARARVGRPEDPAAHRARERRAAHRQAGRCETANRDAAIVISDERDEVRSRPLAGSGRRSRRARWSGGRVGVERRRRRAPRRAHGPDVRELTEIEYERSRTRDDRHWIHGRSPRPPR